MSAVLTETAGLTESDLAEIADLERRVLAHDGGRLKLEWSSLRGRSGDRVDDLLWRDGGRLVGFLGFYQFGSQEVELAGMVDPQHRRRGIATELVHAALPLAAERGRSRVLLVTPRSTSAGAAFARAKGAALEHSEHYLSLGATPGPVANPTVAVRPAVPADRDDVVRILSAAFGYSADHVDLTHSSPAERTMLVERDGAAVATVALNLRDGVGGIYGLAVDPSLQGHGIGREVLAVSCRELRAQGADRVTLEVAIDNDRALGLYLSVGFVGEATEDYFELPTSGRPPTDR